MTNIEDNNGPMVELDFLALPISIGLHMFLAFPKSFDKPLLVPFACEVHDQRIQRIGSVVGASLVNATNTTWVAPTFAKTMRHWGSRIHGIEK